MSTLTLQSITDSMLADSKYSSIPADITIALKKNKAASRLVYFVRFTDVSKVVLVIKEGLAEPSAEHSAENSVLVGDENLEELITVNMNLFTKSMWSFTGSKVLLEDVVVTAGTLTHGVASSKSLSVLEVQALSTDIDEAVPLQLIHATTSRLVGDAMYMCKCEHGRAGRQLSDRAKQWLSVIAALT